MKKYANRRDANETEIIKALRDIGASVYQLDLPVDLLVGFRARNFLLEIKDGDKSPSRQGLTETQKRFVKLWRGQVRIVNSVDEAIRVVTGSYVEPK